MCAIILNLFKLPILIFSQDITAIYLNGINLSNFICVLRWSGVRG